MRVIKGKMAKEQEIGLISVVIPAYNAEDTVEQTVRSVCRQTYENIEIIVVDDGSTDGTGAVIDRLEMEDRRIRALHAGQNCGVSATRIAGVKAAAGEWIAFLDSDDMWRPEKLEKQVALQKETGGELLFTGVGFISRDGKPFAYMQQAPAKLGYRRLLKRNLIPNSSVLIRRELYERHMVTNDALHEDYACWLNVLREGRTAYGINEPLMIYRLSPGSKSSNKLKAAEMNWRTYRAVGLNVFQAFYYMVWYTVNGFLKYRNLKY